MDLRILCAVLLMTALTSSELTSSTTKGYDRQDSYHSTEDFHLIKNTFAENADTTFKERDKEPLLQDYILDKIEVNARDDTTKIKDFFHESLFDNKETERMQIFKEYIPTNLIINDVKLASANTSNEDNILPFFTEEIALDKKEVNDSTKVENVKIPDNLFSKKKADIQVIKDFASNLKLNEMVQTIKNFFAEKVTDNIKDYDDKATDTNNFTLNNIKVNDVVQSIKDYFSNKQSKTKERLLVPEDFFLVKNSSVSHTRNVTNIEPLKNKELQHLDKTIIDSKRDKFNFGEKGISIIDDYNGTKKVDIVKNFLMEELISNVQNKDFNSVAKTKSYPKATMIKAHKLQPIKQTPDNLLINDNHNDKEQITKQLFPTCSQPSDSKGEYKVHIVKIIFPEKISNENGGGIDKVKTPTEFLHKTTKTPENSEQEKSLISKNILPEKNYTHEETFNKSTQLTENVVLKNNQKITVTNILKTHHDVPNAHNNFTKDPAETEIFEDIENIDRVVIPKDFFPQQNNDTLQLEKAILNLSDFISKDAVMHFPKGNMPNLLNKAIQLKKDKNHTINHKTKTNKLMDDNRNSLIKQTSKMTPNITSNTNTDKFHISKQNLNIKFNDTQNLQKITKSQNKKKTRPTKLGSKIITPFSSKTILPEVLLTTDIEKYRKILVTQNLFTDKYAIYTAKYEITNIILPLNSLNFNEVAKSRTNSKNYIIFFVEADVFPNSTKDYKGLYLYNNLEAQLLLANGRDVAAAYEQSSDVFIATDDGIYIYNHLKNVTGHYGTFNKSLIAIAKVRNADIIYGLTDSKVLYNVTNNGTQWEVIDKIVKPEAIVLDYANNLYFYSANKIPYVYNGEDIITVKNIPAKPSYIQLLRPPLVTESGIPAIIDDKSYIIYSDGKVETADFEFSVHPTAFSVEAVTMQYFAFNKKLYKFSCKQLYANVAK